MPKRVELIPGEDQPDSSLNTETPEWLEQEIAGCSFPDQRLRQRLQQLLQQLSSGLGESIPFACQDWANTKTAYRFLSNPRVNEGAILAGHFESTRNRFAATDSPTLILHDTTEFTFARNNRAPVGLRHKSFRRKGKKGRPLHSVVCGILMHSSLNQATQLSDSLTSYHLPFLLHQDHPKPFNRHFQHTFELFEDRHSNPEVSDSAVDRFSGDS